MRKFLAVLALLALAVTPAFAQTGTPDGVPLGDYVSAVDTDPLMLIWFVGSDTTSAVTVAVETDGNLTLLGAGGVADITIECPLSGAYGGVIDVSDGDCNTAGELVNVINGTAGSEWRIAILSGLASDDINDDFLVVAATEARGNGYVILGDSSVSLTGTTSFFPGELDTSNVKASYFAPSSSNRGIVNDNPFLNGRQVLKYAHENITSSGSVANFVAFCVVPSGSSTGGTYAETVQTLYLEAGAATTATGLINEFNYAGGGLVCEDGKIVTRITTTSALTAQVQFQTGFNEKK